MRRREFIIALGSAALWPLASLAQSSRAIKRIGVLWTGATDDPSWPLYRTALRDGLRSLGWIEGSSIAIEERWLGLGNAGGAAELVSLAPDVIIASTTASLKALQREKAARPVVFTMVSDPVAQGFVASLAHPGGAITGFAAYEFSIGGKWLGFLRALNPRLARVLFLYNPATSPQMEFFRRSIEAAASAQGVAIIAGPVGRVDEIEPALQRFAQDRDGGLIVGQDGFLIAHSDAVLGAAARYRLPAIYGAREFARGGGLMSYDIEFADNWRRAAAYVDRILKGEKPGDLPVQQPTKFKLLINLKTAKALGLDIPPALLVGADEVIE